VTEAIGALVARMAELLAQLEDVGDPGRFFLGTYLRTTTAVGAALDRGLFEDPDWVIRWDVDFAELYLVAVEGHHHAPATVDAPWRLAFGADPGLPPEAHVLLGMNAHINYDLPQSLIRVIGPADFGSADVLARRGRDHERIDDVLASRVGAEDAALERAGGRRTRLDRVLTPVNRRAGRLFLRESRRRCGPTPPCCIGRGPRARPPTRQRWPIWKRPAPRASPTCCGRGRCCCAWPCTASASPSTELWHGAGPGERRDEGRSHPTVSFLAFLCPPSAWTTREDTR
jgi:hypothetical protein